MSHTEAAAKTFRYAGGTLTVGDVLDLADGRQAKILDFLPVGTLRAGTWVLDPRNDLVCAVTRPSDVWPVEIGDGLCCMPSEVMPVLAVGPQA